MVSVVWLFVVCSVLMEVCWCVSGMMGLMVLWYVCIGILCMVVMVVGLL